jgi:hypothetical protein
MAATIFPSNYLDYHWDGAFYYKSFPSVFPHNPQMVRSCCIIWVVCLLGHMAMLLAG